MKITTLLDQAELDAGVRSVKFDAGAMSSGIYFYRMTAHDVTSGAILTAVRKMVMTK